jgi:hypothetical protein
MERVRFPRMSRQRSPVTLSTCRSRSCNLSWRSRKQKC